LNSTGSPDRDPSPWPLGLLLALATAVFLVGLGAAPIERAEIYFLDAARAMVERSDWLVPYYRGEPFYDKPPLTYWLLAASFQAFGPSLFSGRLVAALLALATLGVTFLAARGLMVRTEPLAARGESLPAFAREASPKGDERCIPSGLLRSRARIFSIFGPFGSSPDGRLARLGAAADFHHGLLARTRSLPHAGHGMLAR